METHLAIVVGGGLRGREQVLDDAVEERQVNGGQLGNIQVPHGHEEDLSEAGNTC